MCITSFLEEKLSETYLSGEEKERDNQKFHTFQGLLVFHVNNSKLLSYDLKMSTKSAFVTQLKYYNLINC